jgi:hypothetical protein
MDVKPKIVVFVALSTFTVSICVVWAAVIHLFVIG